MTNTNETARITQAIEMTPVAGDLMLAGRALEATVLLTSIEGVDLDLAISLANHAHDRVVTELAKTAARERAERIEYNIQCLIAEGVDALTAQRRANMWG